MINIVLADDHKIVRDGLRALLELEDDIHIAGEAGTGREALDECLSKKPDILVLDMDMPDLDGLDVTKTIQDDEIPVLVIILTMYSNEQYAVRLLMSGARAFLPKSLSGHDLPDIIRKVHAGETFIPEDMRESVISTMVSAAKRRASVLSDRELQVFTAYAQGKERSEIAKILGVSPRTVETHKRRVMEKLGLKSTADLIKAAIRDGIVREY